jgi:hypothetical protein
VILRSVDLTNAESTFAGITLLLMLTGIVSAVWSIRLIFEIEEFKEKCIRDAIFDKIDKDCYQFKLKGIVPKIRLFVAISFLSFLASTFTCGPARFHNKQVECVEPGGIK